MFCSASLISSRDIEEFKTTQWNLKNRKTTKNVSNYLVVVITRQITFMPPPDHVSVPYTRTMSKLMWDLTEELPDTRKIPVKQALPRIVPIYVST